jgi:hypothetical protein
LIRNDDELDVMLERIAKFQRQVAHMRRTETDPLTYRLSAGGFLAEVDRMNLEVREYLATHPSEASPSLPR